MGGSNPSKNSKTIPNSAFQGMSNPNFFTSSLYRPNDAIPLASTTTTTTTTQRVIDDPNINNTINTSNFDQNRNIQTINNVDENIQANRSSNVNDIFTTSLTNSQKWLIALAFGILAVLIFSGPVFGLTNSVFTGLGTSPLYISGGGPTGLGLFVHFIVFVLLARLILW